MGLSLAQLELRRTRIGSSEVAALLGIDPYKSAFDVWMEKNLPPKPNDEDHRSWGLDMEPAILAHHVRKSGYALMDAPGSKIHPTLPLVCTPDAIASPLDKPGLIDLQAKNDQGHGQIEWGEPGTDDAPLLYVAQVTIEVGVLRAVGIEVTHGELVVSLRGAPPVAYHIGFNAELFGDLAEICSKWKRDHLDTGKPPEGSPMEVAEYIKRKYVKHTGDLLEPTAELATMVQAVATMRATRKAAEEECIASENHLKEAIGEAAGIAGLCTWESQTRKAHVVKESTSRVLRLVNTKGED